MFKTLKAVVVGGLLGPSLVVGAWAEEPTAGEPVDLKEARFSHAKIEPGEGDGTARSITFQPADWPGMTISFDEPRDWRRVGALSLELANPNPFPVKFFLRVDDDPSADGRRHCRAASATIRAGESGKFLANAGPDPMDLGVRGLPVPAGYQALNLEGEHELNLAHVTGFVFFLQEPKEPTSLLLKDVRLLPRLGAGGMRESVDRFGQHAGADWPGKAHDEADLVERRKAEAEDLKAHPAMPDRNRFGGWAKGPKREAAGFFRTAKIDGKWWLVDPDGALFFSSGVDCVGEGDPTIITGRESWFSWLPGEDDPMSKFYGRVDNVHSGPVDEGRTFNFFRANLVRKYGPRPGPAFREISLKRLPSWGFNTIGNWSSHAFHHNGRVPYVFGGSIGGDHKRVSSGEDYWGQMHDPFDPEFALNVERSLDRLVPLVKGDPWCVGYFIDNELSWGGFDLDDAKSRFGLALGALKAEADSPAKIAFLRQLKTKYKDVDKLNAAWGSSLADWDALASRPWKPETLDNEALKADMAAFVTGLAREYFRIVRDALKKRDPDHLYLGCRFAWSSREAIHASAEFCDVVSFNIYDRRIDRERWAIIEELNKPAIIGEFHIGALDRGMWHAGLQSAADQDERARVFQEYVESVIDHPSLVGCHWFQYVDQPLTGRAFDGENYNIGFLSVTDTPYPEMVAAARSTHQTMYERRAQAQP